MNRRTFITRVSVGIVALRLAVEAQQVRVSRIGVILQGGPYYAAIDGLRDGLRELGLEEGKQFVLHVRDTKGDLTSVAAAWPAHRAMFVLAAAVPLSAALEAPVLSNHWLLAAAVSLAYVATAGRWERFTPAARWALVVFYAFAAFAKLNTGFLDPTTSCAVFYANQTLTAVRLPALSPAGTEAAALIVATVLAEASVPVLLVMPLTRHAGVLLGLAFHGLVSLNVAQHVQRAADRPDLVAPVPWWWRWMPLRAIDSRDPPRCQTAFLPAL